MTLTERERFIQHFSTISTMRLMMEKFIVDTGSSPYRFFSKERHDMESDLKAIRETRCRKLSDQDISDLFEELSEEALLGGSVLQEMLEENYK